MLRMDGRVGEGAFAVAVTTTAPRPPGAGAARATACMVALSHLFERRLRHPIGVGASGRSHTSPSYWNRGRVKHGETRHELIAVIPGGVASGIKKRQLRWIRSIFGARLAKWDGVPKSGSQKEADACFSRECERHPLAQRLFSQARRRAPERNGTFLFVGGRGGLNVRENTAVAPPPPIPSVRGGDYLCLQVQRHRAGTAHA